MAPDGSETGEGEPDRPPVLLVPRADAAAALERQIDRGVRLRETPQDETRARKDEFEDWTDETIAILRHMFDSNVEARRFCATSRVRDGRFYAADYFWNSNEEFFDPLNARLSALRILEDRLSLIPEAPRIDVSVGRPSAIAGPKALAAIPEDSRIVIVHGHDPDRQEEVRQMLIDLALEPVILEAPITASETVERDTAGAAFAVVLLTPDDVGGPRQSSAMELRLRPRQDVLVELGFLCGQLGPRRVGGLHNGDLEIPSAFPAVAWIHLDPDGGWRLKLAKEIKAAGLDIDMNRL